VGGPLDRIIITAGEDATIGILHSEVGLARCNITCVFFANKKKTLHAC
jgi:hypothetical protein